jgi:hypothetical protein
VPIIATVDHPLIGHYPDALFGFAYPLTGAYFWCPPIGPAGQLDLRALGL